VRTAPRNETLNGAILRRSQAEQLQGFNHLLGPAPFAPGREAPPPNHEVSFEAGTSYEDVFGRQLGVFTAFNYGRSYSSFQDGTNDRYTVDLTPRRFMSEDRSRIGTEFGGSANFSLELSEHHHFTYNLLINNNVEDEARVLTGFDLFQGSEPLVMNQLHYTERQIMAHQFLGRHSFPEFADNRLEWQVSYVRTSQDEPDYRFFNATQTADGAYTLAGANLPQPNLPTRFFRELEENNLLFKFDDTQPFELWKGLEGALKFGFYRNGAERTSLERAFSYLGDPVGWDTYRGDINDFLTEDNLNYTATRRTGAGVSQFATNYSFLRYVSNRFGNNDSEGSLEVYAGYFMVDAPLLDWLRVVTGARAESTLYKVKGASREGTGEESALIDQVDVLPAASLVFTPITNMNVRLSFAQTIARPSFREISPGSSYDPVTDDLFVGNPDLQISHIDNYDLRWEWFRRPGETISLSFFYKEIDQPIERYIQTLFADQSTFLNRESAKLYGVEFEIRSRLDIISRILEPFTLGANIAYIESEVPLTADEITNKQRLDPGNPDNRPLYDQSPFVINLDLSYDNPGLGTSVTLVSNLTGERIFLANPAGPDIYEHPPVTLDLVFSQRLGKHWKLKFSAKNLLDAEYLRTYGPDSDDPVNVKYRRGRTFSLSLSAEF
jgi:TonB-dependent receptor